MNYLIRFDGSSTTFEEVMDALSECFNDAEVELVAGLTGDEFIATTDADVIPIVVEPILGIEATL